MVERSPASPARRPRRRLARSMVSLLLMLAIGAVGFAGWFRYTYGSWPGMAVGNRITWCDRDWRVAVTDLTRAEVAADAERPPRPVFDYPPVLAQAQVHAALRSPAERARNPLAPCAPTLYVETGPDRFSSYVVGGG